MTSIVSTNELKLVSSEAILLPNEIAGASCTAYCIPPNEKNPFSTSDARATSSVIYYVIEGEGCFECDDNQQVFGGLSVFIPKYGSNVAITNTGSKGVRLLRLTWDTNESDRDVMAAAEGKLPYFIRYDDAPTYKEAFKSPKTTSRTLVPPGVIPRFATGSVQTTGPDEVGRHAHPMLEQFFLGLPGNRCAVSADDATAELGPFTLLHIPLGSMHGVTVAEGDDLHYIWIDMFPDASGERWIKDMHTQDDAKGSK